MFKFIKIVKKISEDTGNDGGINNCYVIWQLIALFFWTATFSVEGYYLITSFNELISEYTALRNIVIMDIVGTVAASLNFLIIGAVIYKSSKVVMVKHDPLLEQDVSLMAYLRNNCVQEQSRTIEERFNSHNDGSHSPKFGKSTDTAKMGSTNNAEDSGTSDAGSVRQGTIKETGQVILS